MESFNVGDKVTYTNTSGIVFKATITNITQDYFSLEFGEDYYQRYITYTNQYSKSWLFRVKRSNSEEDPNDNLTPVERRIRKLWNNSNWIKTNPQRAY
jgi:hypothetical protein